MADDRSAGAWSQVAVADAADRLLVYHRLLELQTEPRQPWVLIDLTSIEPNLDFPEHEHDQIKRLSLREFRACTRAEEWSWAWDAPEDYSSELYRFWPHRAASPVFSQVSFYPDGDDQAFVLKGFEWGIYAYCSHDEVDGWALLVFAEPLLRAFASHWPPAWSRVMGTSEHQVRGD